MLQKALPNGINGGSDFRQDQVLLKASRRSAILSSAEAIPVSNTWSIKISLHKEMI